MRDVSTLFELLGMALVVFAAYLVDLRLALALGGVLLVAVGYVLDRPTAPREVDG